MNLKNLSETIKKKKSRQWETLAQLNALKLFHKAAEFVPAYADFLKKNSINFLKIKTYSDLSKVPYTDKKNYIDKYSLKDLNWYGKLSDHTIINTSSGTTGKPYFWPCSQEEFQEGAYLHEFILKEYFSIDKYKSLIIVCFGMGTWVAGTYTLLSTYLMKSNNTIGIMTPGFNKVETLRILNEIAPLYEQTIIAGYPTFIKDVLEEFKTLQTRADLKMKFLFAGEGFTESWRDYVLSMISKEKDVTDTISILGSADASLMGFETPLSIKIRRITQTNHELRKNLFHSERVPSIVNYIPNLRFFESYNEELLLTADRSVPFIRYNIHDVGGIISHEDLTAKCAKHNISINKTDLELPFVYIFGRGKFTASIYAVNIYPENVREVLFSQEVSRYVTGKFLIETKYLENHRQYLELKVELSEGIEISPHLSELIANTFLDKVTKLNSEFNKVFQEYGHQVKPKVLLHRYNDKDVFPKDQVKKTG